MVWSLYADGNLEREGGPNASTRPVLMDSLETLRGLKNDASSIK